MIRYLRELRLLPIAVVACACLLTLIAADFLLDDESFTGGNMGTRARQAAGHNVSTKTSEPQSVKGERLLMFTFPDRKISSCNFLTQVAAYYQSSNRVKFSKVNVKCKASRDTLYFLCVSPLTVA